jgi:hypothetical protein
MGARGDWMVRRRRLRAQCPRVRRAPETLGLLLVACEGFEIAGEHQDPRPTLVALRRLVDRAPDDALGQAYLGCALAFSSWFMPPAMGLRQRQDAKRALDRAGELDPRVGETWWGRAALENAAANPTPLARFWMRRRRGRWIVTPFCKRDVSS